MQAVAGAAVVVAGVMVSGWVQHPGQGPRLLLFAAISYLPSTFIATFIGVAMCAAVAEAMDGGHLSLGQAIGVSLRRVGQIFVWSLLATGVGLLLEQVAARLPLGGKLLTWLAGVAWSLGTLFVLPILAFEGCDAGEAVRLSARLVKGRWGEGVTGSLVIAAWTIIVMIPVGLIAGGISGAAGHSNHTTQLQGIAWAVVFGIAVVVGSIAWAAARVFSVALYRYATTDGTTGPFNDVDLQHPFRTRRGNTVPTSGPDYSVPPPENGPLFSGRADQAPLQEWLKRRRRRDSRP